MKLSEKWKCPCFINCSVDNMKWNRQNLPIFIAVYLSLLSLLLAVFKLNFSFRISIFENILRNSFSNQDFEMCILKFGSQNKSLDPVRPKFGTWGGRLMRSNSDYSGLKGCYHEGPRMKAQGFDNWWELMATFGNLWQLLATFGNLRQLLATYGNFWELMATYGNFLQVFATHGKF